MLYQQLQTGPIEASRSNPLARGVVLLSPGIVTLNDVVARRVAVPTGAIPLVACKVGLLPSLAGSQYYDFPAFGAELTDTMPAAVAWVQQPVAATAYHTTMQFRPSGSAAPFAIYQSASDSNYYLVAGVRGTASACANFSASVGPLTNGQLDVFMVIAANGFGSVNPADYKLFKNGIKQTTSTPSTLSANSSTTTRVGALAEGSDTWKGLVGNVVFWSRAPSDAEASSITSNIWQIIEDHDEYDDAAPVAGAGTLAESAAATDSCGATVIMAAAVADAYAAADALAAYGLFTAQLAETAAGVDSLSATAVLGATRAESLAASDATATGALTMTGAISESGAAADVPAAFAQMSATGAETLTANDATTTGSATIAGSVSEAGSALDAPSTAALFAVQYAETISSVDGQGAATVGGLLVAEVASAAELAGAVSLATTAVTEVASGSDAIGAAAVMGATVSEASAATDASNPAGATIAAAIAESGAATDQYAALMIAVAASLEQVVATATMASMISATASAMEAGLVFDTAWAIVAGQVIYARAPAGPGYTPRQNAGTTRPAAIQRNNR